MSYSEIVAAGFESKRDNVTEAMIGYLKKDSGDSYTKAGTWVSFLDDKAVQNYTKYAMSKGLGGAFSFDLS